MFNERMDVLRAEIAELELNISNTRNEITACLDGNDLEKAKELKATLESNRESLEKAQNDLKLYEEAMNNVGRPVPGKTIETKNEDPTMREKVNNFLRSKGAEKADLKTVDGGVEVPAQIFNAIDPAVDGIIKTDTKPVTSEEIVYQPEREVKTVVDLKKYAKLHNAQKGSGKYPILKKATTRMNSVAELEKNPKLAKPEFDEVEWSVETYRGAIPLSQESIDDADVDLVALVAENVNEIRLNTTNYFIAEAMKKFTAATVATLDDVKKILNVELDPAYNAILIVTQSAYNWLDTLKDGNGRYLLQDSILSPSGKMFAGHVLDVIPDETLGEKGDALGFIGDVSKAILFANRKELGLRWADNDIYGQYLQAVMRFGVAIADGNAGYFVTFPGEAAAGK